MIFETSCLVIGAGIAGLLAAQRLARAGLSVTVIEKDRSVGGRLATRRMGGGVFDYGAQFFTVRHPDFQRLLSNWQAAGLVREWSRGFATLEQPASAEGHPHYCIAGGMAALPRYLARRLDVRTNLRAVAIRRATPGWQVETDDGSRLGVQALLLTPPVPQILALLQAGNTALDPAIMDLLHSISYQPCLALMAVLDTPPAIPAPGAVQIDAEPLAWIADNRQKGISSAVEAVTLHASPAFSQAHWKTGDEAVARLLLPAAATWLRSMPTRVLVKRWRYARPVGLATGPCLVASTEPPLVLAGDAFVAPRLEGAVLSGLAGAEAIIQYLN